MKRKKKDIQVPTPKTRRTWKIKPYTRVHSSKKSYHRHRQHLDDEKMIIETLATSDQERKGSNAELRFCPRCGGDLALKKMDGRHRLVCSACDSVFYQNPVPAVAAIIPHGNQIVLVRRAEEPRLGYWCLPAGFLELDESPEECAVREVKEETGLDIRVRELFAVALGRDDPRTKVVLIIYLAEMLGGKLQAGDDASDVDWFDPQELPDHIAFATHRQAIARYFGERYEQDTSP